jgi:hypothetical protein
MSFTKRDGHDILVPPQTVIVYFSNGLNGIRSGTDVDVNFQVSVSIPRWREVRGEEVRFEVFITPFLARWPTLVGDSGIPPSFFFEDPSLPSGKEHPIALDTVLPGGWCANITFRLFEPKTPALPFLASPHLLVRLVARRARIRRRFRAAARLIVFAYRLLPIYRKDLRILARLETFTHSPLDPFVAVFSTVRYISPLRFLLYSWDARCTQGYGLSDSEESKRRRLSYEALFSAEDLAAIAALNKRL